METEIWKEISGYNGYFISTLGRVHSVRVGNSKNTGYRFLRNLMSGNDKYYSVCLYSLGKRKRITIHRLVALHFLDSQPGKNEVNHINGNKFDNRLCNLEWCTSSENQNHAYELGLKKGKKGLSHWGIKSVIQYASDGSFIKEWGFIAEIESSIGVNNSSITRCCRGQQKTAGGFIWKYKS